MPLTGGDGTTMAHYKVPSLVNIAHIPKLMIEGRCWGARDQQRTPSVRWHAGRNAPAKLAGHHEAALAIVGLPS